MIRQPDVPLASHYTEAVISVEIRINW